MARRTDRAQSPASLQTPSGGGDRVGPCVFLVSLLLVATAAISFGGFLAGGRGNALAKRLQLSNRSMMVDMLLGAFSTEGICSILVSVFCPPVVGLSLFSASHGKHYTAVYLVDNKTVQGSLIGADEYSLCYHLCSCRTASKVVYYSLVLKEFPQ